MISTFPVFAQPPYDDLLPTDKGTLNVGISTIPPKPDVEGPTTLKIDFINPITGKIQEHIDYKIVISKDEKDVFGPIPLTHTSTGSVKIPVEFQQTGNYQVLVSIEGILFQPLPLETVTFNIAVGQQAEQSSELTIDSKEGGGCLIATATYDSELAPQVQKLRELRDQKLLQTRVGQDFMSQFNTVYYSFSPVIADYERQNPIFKEFVKITITPLLASLSLLDIVNISSEEEFLVFGVGIIGLNAGFYLGLPIFLILKIKKIHEKYV